MESFRSVHISYSVSGETLGIVWKKPEHEWTTFVIALHYYAARKIGVMIWCVDLLWEYDPWDEAQLPMNVHVQCSTSSVFPEIAESTLSFGRCCCCWEDCEDLDDDQTVPTDHRLEGQVDGLSHGGPAFEVGLQTQCNDPVPADARKKRKN